jgi:cell division transport system permease protein
MKLVGASNNYVAGPFIVEGVITGIISAVLGIGLLYPLAAWVKDATMGVYGGINLVAYYMSNFTELFLTLLAAGVILGIISSILAVRRYL